MSTLKAQTQTVNYDIKFSCRSVVKRSKAETTAMRALREDFVARRKAKKDEAPGASLMHKNILTFRWPLSTLDGIRVKE